MTFPSSPKMLRERLSFCYCFASEGIRQKLITDLCPPGAVATSAARQNIDPGSPLMVINMKMIRKSVNWTLV